MSTSKKAVSFQEMQSELEAIIADLQREDLDIDEALKKYERGMGIVKDLSEYLDGAENTVRQLQARFSPDSE